MSSVKRTRDVFYQCIHSKIVLDWVFIIDVFYIVYLLIVTANCHEGYYSLCMAVYLNAHYPSVYVGVHDVLKHIKIEDFLTLVISIRSKLHLLTKPEVAPRFAKSLFVALPVAVKVGRVVDTTLDHLHGQRTMSYNNKTTSYFVFVFAHDTARYKVLNNTRYYMSVSPIRYTVACSYICGYNTNSLLSLLL